MATYLRVWRTKPPPVGRVRVAGSRGLKWGWVARSVGGGLRHFDHVAVWLTATVLVRHWLGVFAIAGGPPSTRREFEWSTSHEDDHTHHRHQRPLDARQHDPNRTGRNDRNL